MKLHLTDRRVRPWCQAGRTWASGVGVDAGGAVLAGPALAERLEGPPRSLADRVAELSGTFAAVCEGDGEVALAVDRIRSTPLFYGRDVDGALCLSDDARWLVRAVRGRLDTAAAAAEMMLQGAPIGASTLSSAVRAVRAGSVVVCGASGLDERRYFAYGEGAPRDASEEYLVQEGARRFEQAFERLAVSVDGLPLAIPLSGGLDSRLIAALLVRAGRSDAVCYTYGREGSFEARASRMVAEALGLRWAFVPYSNRDWHRWAASDAYQRYRRAAGGVAGIEHEQDWPAVAALRERGVLPAGAVVVPGHAGDFLGGSHLPPRPAAVEADPAAWIWERYYTGWPTGSLRPALARTLRDRIQAEVGGAEGVSALLRFGWQERQAKVIAHSVRVYEDHGLDWRLPFWADADVLDFWGRVPASLLRGRRLYDLVLREMLGNLYDLPSTLRPEGAISSRLRRVADVDHGRYGMWLGPYPALGALKRRVGDLDRVEHPVVGPVIADLVRPIARRPIPWATLNGLLALDQIRDLARDLG